MISQDASLGRNVTDWTDFQGGTIYRAMSANKMLFTTAAVSYTDRVFENEAGEQEARCHGHETEVTDRGFMTESAEEVQG